MLKEYSDIEMIFSVDIWVEEMRNESYNPSLLYKTQGVEPGNDVDNIAKNVILLCLQTEFRKEMAKKFGNGKVIFIDSTHSTTMYNFLLITVTVVDEFDARVPIAWAISNDEDQIKFFKIDQGHCWKSQAKILHV
uniref:ZSWIM1/3 RNaseH-like domain-containing protein n=1 Tax=Amphimedon queenslandica TaxID=400682 RepID=A0A1X7VH97_AMPQE